MTAMRSSAAVGRVTRTEATAEFFDAAAKGVLALARCADGHWSSPSHHVCEVCAEPTLRLEAASGRARLVSWAVVHPRATEGFEAPPAVVAAIVELAEGPWWWTMLAGVDPGTLAEGLALRVSFEQPEGYEPVPVFVLDDGHKGVL